MSVQRNPRRTKGRCTHRVHYDGAGEIVSGKAHAEGVVPDRAFDRGFHAAARGRVTAEDTVAVIDELIAEAAREFSTEYTIKLVQATGTHTQRGLNIP